MCCQVAVKNFAKSQEITCAEVSILIKLKATPVHVFSDNFAKFFENILFIEYFHDTIMRMAAKHFYLQPRILAKNTSFRAFQYKVLNNMLYLNLKLFQFRVSTTSLRSYCNQYDGTVERLLSTCNQVIPLWTELKLYFANDIKLRALCPQMAILGSINTDDRFFITQDLILLIFKFYVYKSRDSGNLSFSDFFHKLVKIKNL